MPYDADYTPPPGYVKIVNNTNTPTEMVVIQRSNGNLVYDYAAMQAYTLPTNYSIPTTALKNTLTSSDGTLTWVTEGEGNMLENRGNWADWVSDPVDAGDGDYALMTVNGDGQGISFTNINDQE